MSKTNEDAIVKTAKGKVAIVPMAWLNELIAKLEGHQEPSFPHSEPEADDPSVLSFEPRGRGIYRMTGKVKEVRGRKSIQKVFGFIKANGVKGGQVSMMIDHLKMPSSTIYFALKKLSDKGAIERA